MPKAGGSVFNMIGTTMCSYCSSLVSSLSFCDLKSISAANNMLAIGFVDGDYDVDETNCACTYGKHMQQQFKAF